MTSTLGSRLRELRHAHDCSLSELSRLSGIGKGTISELENDRRGARLNTLFALTSALQCPLSDLLPAPSEGLEVVRGDAVEAVLLGSWSTTDGTVEAYRAVIGTSEQFSAPHASGVEETVTVLSGQVRVGSDGDGRVLDTGASHRYDGDRPHRFVGIGEPAHVVLLMHYLRPDQDDVSPSPRTHQRGSTS